MTPLKALAAAATFAILAAPAAAFDIENMTEAERTAFNDQIRAYLLENPEVIMEAVAVLEQRQAASQAQADSDLIAANSEAIFNDGTSWVGGNPQGDVTLVEFMDYRCGYCRRAFPEVEQLVEIDGNIRFVIKEFPILGEESVLASRFAIAVRNQAGDDAYKQAHDALMSLQGTINEAALGRLAREQGLDADAIMAAMNAPAVTQELRANRALAQTLEINGTPSFVLDDRMLRGYVPLERMLAMVDAVRTE